MQKPFWERNTSARAQREIANVAGAAGLDRRALNVLFNTYYDVDHPVLAWVQQKDTPEDDLRYARDQGVMFEPVTLDHDSLIERLIECRDALDRGSIADAFLISLRDRRLDLRSTLGSYAVFLHLEPHAYAPSGRWCAVCGVEGAEARAIDRSMHAFLRLKLAGSIHHDHATYAATDLALFSGTPMRDVSDEDRDVLRRVLVAIRGLPATAGLNDLQRALSGLFASTKLERQLVLELLGYTGVLQPGGRDSYGHRFVTYAERQADPPANYWKREWRWPVQHWTGADSVNDEAVAFWFGST